MAMTEAITELWRKDFVVGSMAEVFEGGLGGKRRMPGTQGSRAGLLHHEHATAGTVGRLVWVGVVAFFLVFLHNSVSAVVTNRTVGAAAVVSAGVLLDAVVALFTGRDDAVAAHRHAFAARRVETGE